MVARGSVFLSHLVSDYLADNGQFRPEKRQFVAEAIGALQEVGYAVECAALHEDYGAVKLLPVEFTAYDLAAIARCSLFVLITAERVSADMYLEVGLAAALGLPIVVFIPASARLTYMLHGLEELGRVRVVRFNAEGDLPALIARHLCAPAVPGSPTQPATLPPIHPASLPATVEELKWEASR